jgi:hypothetical protein
MRKTKKFNRKQPKRKTVSYYKRNKKLKYYGGMPLNRLNLQLDTLDTKHEADGDIAQEDILKLLPGLPQNREDEEHGLGAERRQKWLENEDWEAWKENIGIADGNYMVQLPKHIRERKNPNEFSDEEIKEILIALKPFKQTKKSKPSKKKYTKSK